MQLIRHKNSIFNKKIVINFNKNKSREKPVKSRL